MSQINVYLLPSLAEPDRLSNRTSVVVDVLRATTTIIHALAAGAQRVIPCLEVAQARKLAAEFQEPVLLGGERGGLTIDGFDLGNSPAEYTRERVGGKTVVFTTTNGTRAMEACRQAKTVMLGAFVNFCALCERLQDAGDLDIVCAGTENEISREDVLLAGAIVDDLLRRSNTSADCNDQALIAADAWRAAQERLTISTLLEDRLKDSCGGRNLLEIGHERDIEIAANLDHFALVPTLDVTSWTIHG